jgi:hypothetical protein
MQLGIKEQISELISSYIKNKNHPELYRIIAQELNILPIFFNWEGFIGIRPDSTFIFYDEEKEKWKEENNRAWQITALVDGSKKYKVLKRLLPERTDDAVQCSECEGTGNLLVSGKIDERAICGSCFGLGWTNSYLGKLKL